VAGRLMAQRVYPYERSFAEHYIIPSAGSQSLSATVKSAKPLAELASDLK
jgi:hypothetical protein